MALGICYCRFLGEAVSYERGTMEFARSTTRRCWVLRRARRASALSASLGFGGWGFKLRIQGLQARLRSGDSRVMSHFTTVKQDGGIVVYYCKATAGS